MNPNISPSVKIVKDWGLYDQLQEKNNYKNKKIVASTEAQLTLELADLKLEKKKLEDKIQKIESKLNKLSE